MIKASAAVLAALSWMVFAGAVHAPSVGVAAATNPQGAGTAKQQAEGPALDPAVYHHVAQVTWVVSDLDRVVSYWHRLGIEDIQRDNIVDLPDLSYRGTADPAKVKQATAQVGSLQIRWIQPVQGGKLWREELREHGDGVYVLSYDVPSPREFDEQVKYFASKGVGVVVANKWHGPAGPARMAYLDTAAKGGGTMIGLIDDPNARPQEAAKQSAENEYPFEKINHFAWVVHDVRSVEAYYVSLGFKPFASIDHNISLDRVYHGRPGDYEMWLGWDRTGDAPFEWVQQIRGNDIYVDDMKAHGEGFNHFGATVTDMGAALKLMTSRGAPPSQTAAWNTPRGKGRSAYLDTEPYGGVSLELIYDPK